MRKEDRTLKVLNLLYDEGADPEYASPDFVADFAYNRGIALQSDDVVFISNVYGEKSCPTGRQEEVNHD